MRYKINTCFLPVFRKVTPILPLRGFKDDQFFNFFQLFFKKFQKRPPLTLYPFLALFDAKMLQNMAKRSKNTKKHVFLLFFSFNKKTRFFRVFFVQKVGFWPFTLHFRIYPKWVFCPFCSKKFKKVWKKCVFYVFFRKFLRIFDKFPSRFSTLFSTPKSTHFQTHFYTHLKHIC